MPSVRTTLRPPGPLDFALAARLLRRSPRNLVDRVDEDGTWTRACSSCPASGRGPPTTCCCAALGGSTSFRPASRRGMLYLCMLGFALAAGD